MTTVLTTATLDAAGVGLVMPILPTLLARIGTADAAVPLHVGLLTALYAVMQFICAPLLGRLSDRYGRRPVLLISLAGATIDYLVLALASSLWILYPARAIAGITGATNAVTATVITDITPTHERAKRYGWLGACYGGGMIAGPAIGGFFGALSPHLPFLIAAILTTVNLLLSLTLLQETRPQPGDETQNFTPAASTLTAIPGMALLLTAFGLVQFIGQAPGSTWVLFTQHRLAWNPGAVGISLSVFGLIQVIVQAMLTGPIVKRVGEVKAVLLGIVTDAAGLIGLVFVVDDWAMVPILMALGLGSITVPALQTLLSQRAPGHRQGRLQGTLAGLNSLSSIVGPLIFTSIFALTRTGADGGLWLCAVVFYLPCTILFLCAARRQ
ncbi:Tet(A)/Tet(B)/Tet(C) family tetracycline efflux MFS transporter [Brevibacterium sp. 91QC2O2]|uniref:Tet(A)/Tet(B)/Tet(C) family tetracycline efflux MFS transporter n=1 Tax=Brevibacterium sp. 91QC2O2 TaxID=2968458 RepID=UPI0027B8BEBB|nr:Tet(A)/Tet(B)/Tet(C) family tetracycline efflux MFS transporter [Brevibacterium sp. 91QC2O2]